MLLGRFVCLFVCVSPQNSRFSEQNTLYKLAITFDKDIIIPGKLLLSRDIYSFHNVLQLLGLKRAGKR